MRCGAGGDDYRGVAVVAEDVTRRELMEMHEAGVRGVRFNFVKRLGGGRPLSVHRTILGKIEPLGWHAVVYFDAEDLEDLAPFLRGIEVPVVIDHMGRAPVGHSSFDAMCPRIHRKAAGRCSLHGSMFPCLAGASRGSATSRRAASRRRPAPPPAGHAP